MSRHDTYLLDNDTWDLVIDSSGNWAVASPPYALRQDVASAAMLYSGELWYNKGSGVPYFEDILGHRPPAALLQSYMETAALTVPGVMSAQCVISLFNNRVINGEINFIDEVGEQNGISF